MVLKSDNGSNIQYKFIAEKENDNIKIYRNFVDIPITFAFATFRKRVRFVGIPIPNKAALSLLELGSVSFKGVDLSNIEFHNVNWLKEKVLFLITRNAIVDEKLMGKDTSYEDVAKIYNQLRKNYESRLLFNEASHFFVGEMEAIRKSNLKGKSRRKKLYSLGHLIYKYLALYGESAFLPLVIWTPSIIAIFILLRYLLETCSVEFESIISSATCSETDPIIDSFAAYFQFPRSQNALDTIERIISIPFLGTAFIAIRRKFERIK